VKKIKGQAEAETYSNTFSDFINPKLPKIAHDEHRMKIYDEKLSADLGSTLNQADCRQQL
jgi:hypothetical protein